MQSLNGGPVSPPAASFGFESLDVFVAQFQILFQVFRVLQKRIGYSYAIFLDDAVRFEESRLVLLQKSFQHVLGKTETERAGLIEICEHMAVQRSIRMHIAFTSNPGLLAISFSYSASFSSGIELFLAVAMYHFFALFSPRRGSARAYSKD